MDNVFEINGVEIVGGYMQRDPACQKFAVTMMCRINAAVEAGQITPDQITVMLSSLIGFAIGTGKADADEPVENVERAAKLVGHIVRDCALDSFKKTKEGEI